MKIQDQLYKVVFGIRHKRTFSMTNISGHILDALASLNGKNGFPKQCFTKAGLSGQNSGFRLSDDEETLIIDGNLDGLVFTCDMLAEPKLSLDQLKDMFLAIMEQYTKYSPGKSSINRIGIIYFYKFANLDNSARLLLSSLSKHTDFDGIPDQFMYRFSVKHPTVATLIPNELYDYRNTIFTINAERTPGDIPKPPDLIELNIDHQIYFYPERGYSSNIVLEHYSHFQTYLEHILKKNLILDLTAEIEGHEQK